MRWRDLNDGPARRTCSPSLEGLESRDLPSAMGGFLGPSPMDQHLHAASAKHAAELSPGLPAETHRVHALGVLHKPPTAATRVDQKLIPGLVNLLYPRTVTPTQPITIGATTFGPNPDQTFASYETPQPSASELRREEFFSRFVGKYFIGAPRFSNQASTIHIYSNGNDAGTNQYLHGRAQLLIFPPADPNAMPDPATDPIAGQYAGLVSLFPSNFLNTSSTLFFDITNPPDFSDPANPSTVPSPKVPLDHGLPSHLGFSLDPVGTGLYTNPAYATNPVAQTDAKGNPVAAIGGSAGAVAFLQGGGTIDLKYIPDRRPRAGSLSSGRVIVTIQGLVNLPGINNSIAKPIN
ncbi:MAG: hypothetical protein NVSMB9_25220 [Isosphaeraceae bacterium]